MENRNTNNEGNEAAGSFAANEPEGPGRKTRLTPQVQETICKHLMAGNYFSVACQLSGVPYSTATGWLKRGQGKDKNRATNAEFTAFAEAVNVANAYCEALHVAQMKQAGKNDWRFHMMFLERRWPERWGRFEQITKLASKMTEAELNAAIAQEETGMSADAYR